MFDYFLSDECKFKYHTKSIQRLESGYGVYNPGDKLLVIPPDHEEQYLCGFINEMPYDSYIFIGKNIYIC